MVDLCRCKSRCGRGAATASSGVDCKLCAQHSAAVSQKPTVQMQAHQARNEQKDGQCLDCVRHF